MTRFGLLVAALLLSGCGTATPPPPEPTATPTHDSGSPVLRKLARLKVLDRRPYVPGYDRRCNPGPCEFGVAWTDLSSAPDGHNGCTTREDVLQEQLTRVSMRFDDPRHCRVYDGVLHDPYTGRSFHYRGHQWDIQIDHVVPLAAAWHRGAARWSQARRVRFANDTRLNLLAVGSAANQDKGSSGPDRWLPPNRAFRCTYVTKYVDVLTAYRLPVLASEAAAIRRVARGC